ncbi:hypothetical protein SELMODRAFT_419656 [Selaginella moellendorffii]|uniref:Uncharacterized protein n=1 Tax=Selaginella moellendorffii TaxID=88036 RepID=D8S9L9_SELML|nr:hypothetical protein SELMODRAFT_419656 [Selaginella moellendorffii]
MKLVAYPLRVHCIGEHKLSRKHLGEGTTIPEDATLFRLVRDPNDGHDSMELRARDRHLDIAAARHARHLQKDEIRVGEAAHICERGSYNRVGYEALVRAHSVLDLNSAVPAAARLAERAGYSSVSSSQLMFVT